MIRILNLHPRIQQSLSAKPLFAIEVGDDAAVLYSVGETPDAIESLDDVLVDQFYWYIGPETSTIHEAGSRPLAKLFSHILQRPIKIAPGDTGSGPCIGLCRSEEHTSELQSLMRISYAVFCLQTQKNTTHHTQHTNTI